MLKRFIEFVMGLIDKTKPKIKDEKLTAKELEFILAKLRTADYKGNEFEMFYNVFKKLTDALDNLK